MLEEKTLQKNAINPQPVLDDITIVIPTIGRSILESCLLSMVEGCCWPGQIIVVDQGSNATVAAWIETLCSFGLKARHLPSSQRGRAAGVNRGLERVKTRFVAITDDDCFVDTNWLKNMANQLRKNPYAIVTGRVEASGEEEVVAVATSQIPAIYRRPRLTFDPMSGGNMGTSIEVIKRVGLFDENARLRCAEDGDWAYRALRSGVPIIYAPEVLVHHYGWRDEIQRTAQYTAYARSHGAFYGKHLRKGDWFIALRAIIHHLRVLRRWLRSTIEGNQELAIYSRAYVTGLLPGIIAGMRIGNQS